MITDDDNDSLTSDSNDGQGEEQPEEGVDRDALIAILDELLGPEGTLRPVPGWKKVGAATSCGDFVAMVLQKWGSNYRNRFFMIDDPEKVGTGNRPEPGDVFVLRNKKNGQRQHVGFVYQVDGDGDDFTWQSAEGGQGPNGDLMWLNPKWRGIQGQTTELQGWKSLADIPRGPSKK